MGLIIDIEKDLTYKESIRRLLGGVSEFAVTDGDINDITILDMAEYVVLELVPNALDYVPKDETPLTPLEPSTPISVPMTPLEPSTPIDPSTDPTTPTLPPEPSTPTVPPPIPPVVYDPDYSRIRLATLYIMASYLCATLAGKVNYDVKTIDVSWKKKPVDYQKLADQLYQKAMDLLSQFKTTRGDINIFDIAPSKRSVTYGDD